MRGKQPGTILDHKYEILEQLGSGGMGDVFLVRHIKLEQKRVIKILRQELAANEAAQRRFQREAQLATQVRHPNVAILYDYESLSDGSLYAVWEYIRGEEVAHFLKRHGRFPLHLALDLAIQGLRGLEAIHAAGVIHRDISPDNLMISQAPSGALRLKIIDMGLAKTLSMDPRHDITQAGMFMGKLQFCSPEQAGLVKGQTLDRRTDLYSFGMVLYEMICGRPPFKTDDGESFIFQRLSEDPLPLLGRNPEVEVPPELDQALLMSLQRKREHRYETAVSFIEALEPILYALPPDDGAPPTLELPGRTSETTVQARSTGSLTREERDALLAEIDRAAARRKKAREDAAPRKPTPAKSAPLPEPAAPPPAAPPPEPEPVSSPPAAEGDLETIPVQVGAPAGVPSHDERVRQAESMVEGYLKDGRRTLAQLALDTLLELAPAHPRRGDYEAWVKFAGDEAEQKRRAKEAVEKGREALQRGDLKAARKRLDAALKAQPGGDVAEAFRAELAAAEEGETLGAAADEHKRNLEAALERDDLEGAQKALQGLTRLEVPKLTLDLYHRRVVEAGHRLRLEDRLEGGDFEGARAVVRELAQAAPESPEVEALHQRIDAEQGSRQREASLSQGIRQVEAFLTARNPDQAELALKILRQMAPEDGRWPKLERKIRSLRAKA